MNLKLDSIDPWAPELHLRVDRLPLVIGRNSDSDVQIDERWVSRRHCEIHQENGALVVRDLRSKYGTLVNGQPVKQAPLRPGDTITIGIRTFRITFVRPQVHATSLPASEVERC